MRLLNTKDLVLEEICVDIPRYAILSHRWGKGEVTYQDMSSANREQLSGWVKVSGCCAMALSRGLSHVWIDTCCIDRSSSAELTESINSMYVWYENATECYALLNDVQKSRGTSSQADIIEEMTESAWFTRGWTLQELIAPAKVLFFNSAWDELYNKSYISAELEEITGIDRGMLEGRASVSDFSLAQRMAWAASRSTTRIEDEAYCLLGIFQVNMTMIYGEGQRAFRRLQEEINKQFDDHTLFAWHDDRPIKPVLAPKVSCFAGLSDLRCIYATNDKRFGHTIANSGLNIKLMLIPWQMNVYVAPLSCGRCLDINADVETTATSAQNYRRMGIFLQQTKYDNHLVRVSVDMNGITTDFVMLDSKIVATKRDEFNIKDQQVFLRQTIVDLSEKLESAFVFSFEHPFLFQEGHMPRSTQDVPTGLPEISPSENSGKWGFIEQAYTHSGLVLFKLGRHGAIRAYLHLAFDLNFAPVCLIVTERGPYMDSSNGPFEGMSSGPPKAVPLSWILARIEEVGSKASHKGVLATACAQPGAETVMHCPTLQLTIRFEIKDATRLQKLGSVWHVFFSYYDPVISLSRIRDISTTQNFAQSRSNKRSRLRHSRTNLSSSDDDLPDNFDCKVAVWIRPKERTLLYTQTNRSLI